VKGSSRFGTRSVLFATAMIGLMLAIWISSTRFLREYDWNAIKRSTGLRVHESIVPEIIWGPSQGWAVVRFTIPAMELSAFIRDNACEPSDRRTFVRYRKQLPSDIQTLPPDGHHFYRSDVTQNGLPFEILVHSSGQVMMYAMMED
jgi:hypothetical protein